MDEKEDLKINDVDEIFESFVKKKLRQLGIKRAGARNPDVGTMSELERSVKLRLEKNMAYGTNVAKVDSVNGDSGKIDERKRMKPDDAEVNVTYRDDDGPPKRKKVKKEKKHKKKKKRKDVWKEKDISSQKEKKKKSQDKKETKSTSKEAKNNEKTKDLSEKSKHERLSETADHTKFGDGSTKNGKSSEKKLLNIFQSVTRKPNAIADFTAKDKNHVVMSTDEKSTPQNDARETKNSVATATALNPLPKDEMATLSRLNIDYAGTIKTSIVKNETTSSELKIDSSSATKVSVAKATAKNLFEKNETAASSGLKVDNTSTMKDSVAKATAEKSLIKNENAASSGLKMDIMSMVKDTVAVETSEKSPKNETTPSAGSKIDNSSIVEDSVTKATSESQPQNKGVAAVSGPKRDIATIRKKIELLKARSEEQKVNEELKGLLKKTDDNQKAGETECRKVETKTSSLTEFRSRNRSKSHSRHRSRSRSRDRKRSRHHHRSRSPRKRAHRRSRSRDRHHRRSRRRSRSPLISTEDKVRLLEIAKANALAQHKANHTASYVSGIGQIVKEGSMTVSQLTSMCKDIATGKDEEILPAEPLTKENAEKLLKEAESIHHPFVLRETPTFNIKPVKSLPVSESVTAKPLSTLSKEYPVSCGQQHHRKEVLESVYGKWEVVAKDEATKKAVKELATSDKVFVEPEVVSVDVGTAIASRISAARQLQDDPQSREAKEMMETAQKLLDTWTKSQQLPGQFTGTTGLTPMPRNMLTGGKQAWFKADDLRNAKPVVGIGKSLLQKMGWKPGTGLGKSMPGRLEPLPVNFKNDRRGLSSFMETPACALPKKPKIQSGPTVKDLSNKHPVSALMEICSKRRWAPPEFRLLDPLNLKIFTFRITVCEEEYIGQPANNKKQAKMLAAMAALQNMGLLPKSAP